ncbi:MAG: nucleoside hydrolase [Nitrospirae bacterium]|nr:nucleoside hydrolase [Nitrospirota bacterium]
MKTERPTRVILDTDPGVDDALALLLALYSPELEVVGVTTVCGNVPVEQATRNLFRVLKLAGTPQNLLIGQGASQPLSEPLQTATHVHGADGLGELDRLRNEDGSLSYPDVEVPPKLPPAQEVWAQCHQRYPENLTLITLGPLTNLALALDSNPDIMRKFRNVISMGGAVAVPGNVTAAAEFNIFVDPHAAQQVFASGLPLTLVPLDVTTQVVLNRERILALAAQHANPAIQFLRDATGHALNFSEQVEGQAILPLHDPLAVGVAIDPTLVDLTPLHVQVETEGRLTKGMTLADRRTIGESLKPSSNLKAALSVDAPRFLALFQDRLCRK